MDNNKNIIIGVLALLVVGGGIWALASGGTGSGTATSTPATTTTTTTTTVSNIPAAPLATTGTLVVASNSGAVVTGKVVPEGIQTTYWYEYGTPALGSHTPSQTVGSGYTSIAAPAFISGLSAHSTYSYRLVAQNSKGTTYGATLSFTTNSNPPPNGSAPSAHTDSATDLMRTSANLAGHVSPDGSDTSYWFEYGTSQSLGNITIFQSAGNGTGSVAGTIAVNGLAPSTKYYYRVDAQNQFGTVTGSILTFTTPGPANPSAPAADTTAASKVAGTSATLNGRVNPDGASTTYWFEYSTDSLLGNILGTTTHQAVAGSGTSNVDVSAAITGLARNTTYSYRLVAQNAQGTTQGDIQSFKTTH